MKKILDYIFFLRPMLIMPALTVIILGIRAADLGEGASPFHIIPIAENIGDVLVLLLLSTLIGGAGFIYNQIHDIESDRNNGKAFFLPEKMISISTAYGMFAVLSLIGLVGAFSINTSLGFIFAIIICLGILYSHPKINYKGKPGKALWSNMLGIGVLPFLIGWIYINDSISLEAVLKSLPYFFAVGAVYLNTALPDREGDRKAGKQTYAVIWKVPRLQLSALMRMITATIFAWMAGDVVMFISSLLSLPFYIRAVYTKMIAHSVLATKISILILSVFACIYFPPYIAIILLDILGTRLYYRWRFNLAYPKI